MMHEAFMSAGTHSPLSVSTSQPEGLSDPVILPFLSPRSSCKVF